MFALACQALQGRLAVPGWQDFVETISRIYDLVKRTEHGGKNADYISILSEQVRGRWTLLGCERAGCVSSWRAFLAHSLPHCRGCRLVRRRNRSKGAFDVAVRWRGVS